MSILTSDEVLAQAKLAGLTIDPAHLPGVTSNLEILRRQAELFMAPPVDPVVEPAPVFHP